MLDRRDFDEWWARETARSGVTNGFVAKHWAEAGFMAAQEMIRAQARAVSDERKATLRERLGDGAKQVPSLLKGSNHGR